MSKGYSGMPIRTWLWWIVLLYLGGCSLVQERPLPEIQPSQSETPALPEAWWQAFADAQLNDLVEHGLRENFSLQAVWARLDQAQALADRAAAGRIPSLDLSAGAGVSRQQGSSQGEEKSLSLGLAASYEVDFWGRVNSSQAAAERERDASAYQLQTAALSLSAQIVNSWLQLQEEWAQEDLLLRQLDTNQQVLDLVELRFRLGKVSSVDVLQQRQLLESSRGELASSRSRSRVLEHQLAVLLGRQPGQLALDRERSLPAMPALPFGGIDGTLIQRRPDLQQQWQLVLAADQRLAVALAERLPRISLTASLSGSEARLEDVVDNWLGNLAANLLLPLVDGGARRAEVQRTRAVTAEALANYRQSMLQAFAEVENALVQERQQQLLLTSLEKQMALSRQLIERTQARYRRGAVDYLRVLSVTLTDQSLERSYLQAQRRLLEFRVALYRAIAGDWPLVRPLEAGDPARGRS